MDFAEVASQRIKQYTVNSIKTNSTNSKQYTVWETRKFVESLDKRLYRNPQFLPFYCKAARVLGFSRVLELQGMVVSDPRIDQPAIFNAEKVFWSVLKKEVAARHPSFSCPTCQVTTETMAKLDKHFGANH